MLDNMRNFGRSWIAKILLGVLIIAVAGFGIPSVFLDLNANTVARVGDENITVRDFQRVYQGQLSQFAQQTGITPTGQDAINYGIPNSALARLANDASADILADRLGLGASDAKLAELIRQDPSFAGALGLFDTSEFSAMLRQSGFTEAEYLELQRKIAGRQQLGFIFDGAQLPQVALDMARSYENDQRAIDYVELNPVLFAVNETPSDEDLTQFFEENQNRFRTVETRDINLLPLTVPALAEGIEVTEEEIAAEYERTAEQYVAEERRTLHQLDLPDAETAAAFQAAQETGESFASAVSAAGLETEVVQLGTFTQAEITDTAVAEAAFALQEGGFTVIEDAGAPRAIWVSAVAPAGQQPLEAVSDQIAQSIAEDRADDMLLDVYDEIEEARAAFLPIADVAAQYGLEIYDIALTRDGAQLADIESLPQDAAPTITDAVFAASEDARVTPAINLGSNRTVFFELEEVSPARDQTLDEVRDEVIAAWQEVQAQSAMTQEAEEIVEAVDAGSDLFTIAAERGRIAQTSGTFSRNAAQSTLNADVAQAAFQGGEGYANYLTTQNGNVVIFQVTDVIPAQADAPSQAAEALEGSFADLLYASFVEGLRGDTGIRINQDAFNRVVGVE